MRETNRTPLVFSCTQTQCNFHHHRHSEFHQLLLGIESENNKLPFRVRVNP